MRDDDKQKLLELMVAIAPEGGIGEHERDDETVFLKKFLPVPDHRRALELDALLILGRPGVGKTELFRVLANPEGRQALVDNLRIRALPSLDSTIWIAGFDRTKQNGNIFPTPETVEARMKHADRMDWRTFWIGLMLGVMFQQKNEALNSICDEVPEAMTTALTNQLPLLSEWLPLARQNLEKLNYALDKLDSELIESDRWLFVMYDEVDRLLPSYLELAAPIRELLAFWLEKWRRWERIRPKIFLRTDLFREVVLGFADASKLQGHKISLDWKVPWLYQLLVKRLANSGQEMADYLSDVPGLISKTHPSLGILPKLDESCFELLVEKMVGKYMGDNPRKGYSYSWITTSLQDAGGQITLRSFLMLFSLAAERSLSKLGSQSLTGSRLLEPADLQSALINTSLDRIRELARSGYPWLEDLKPSLKGIELLMPKKDFTNKLQSIEWSEIPDKQPPTVKPPELLEYLRQLGIIEILSNGLINMPDIYRYGFEVKRNGKLKRPQVRLLRTNV